MTTNSDAGVASRPNPCRNCGVRHRVITELECEDRNMSEATLQSRVVARAKRQGWRTAHAGRGWTGSAGVIITPMAPGWPDLVLAKAGHTLIFMELKREDGEVGEKQVEWLQLLNQTSSRAIVVRPSDLREGRVAAILKHGSPIG